MTLASSLIETRTQRTTKMIHQIYLETGVVLRTIEANRFVSG